MHDTLIPSRDSNLLEIIYMYYSITFVTCTAPPVNEPGSLYRN